MELFIFAGFEEQLTKIMFFEKGFMKLTALSWDSELSQRP